MEKIDITDYPIIDIIKERWSPIIFSDKMIAEQDMIILFEAARWAPSCNNEQPWRYMYAFRGSDAFDKIVSTLTGYNKVWAKDASVLLLSLSKQNFGSGKTPNYHYLYDLGAANAFIKLQAQSMGIYTHTMAGFVNDEIRSLFDVSAEYDIASVMALGYMGDKEGRTEEMIQREEKPRSRKALEEIVKQLD